MSQDKGNTRKRAVEKFNLNDVEDIWGLVSSGEDTEDDDDLYGLDDLPPGGGSFDASEGDETTSYAVEEQGAGDDLLAAGNFSQDLYEEAVPDAVAGGHVAADDLVAASSAEGATEAGQVAEQAAPVVPEVYEFAAQLEFVGGMRQEVEIVRLFEPEEQTVLLIDAQTNDELVVFFAQLACLRISGLPAGITEKQKASSVKEVIETVDGALHHVLVCARQEFGGLLCCFSLEEQTRFPVTLIPKVNIKKRCQDRDLTDILLEKRFISKSILEKAGREFAQLKEMTFEKIIAQRARISHAAIGAALVNAKQNRMLGLQTGEILLLSGLVTEEQILDALEYQEHIQNLEIGQFLLEKGIVKEMEVYISLAEKHKIPFLDLRQRKIPRESLALLPAHMLVKHEILPLVKRDDVVLVATHFVNTDHLRESILKAAACKEVKYVLSPPSQIRKIITSVVEV